MPAPSPLAFWARRQAHETAVHRYDAQSAAPGGPPAPAGAFDPAFAADGVDELIMGFAPRRRYRARDGGVERTLTVRALDAAGRWHVRLTDGGTEVSRDDPAGRLHARRHRGRPLRVPLEPLRRRPGRPHDHRPPPGPGRLERQRPRPLVAAATAAGRREP